MLVTWIFLLAEFDLFTRGEEEQDKVPSKIPRQRVVRSEGFFFELKLTDMKKKYFTKRPHGQKLDPQQRRIRTQDDVGQTLLANVYVERCSFLTPEMKVLRLGPGAKSMLITSESKGFEWI